MFISSTGFKGWALDHLVNTYTKGLEIKGLNTQKVLIPQNKKHIRSIQGWLTMPKSEIAFVMHQDLGMQLMRKKWNNHFNHIIVRYTHHNQNLRNYSPLINSSSIIIVENKNNYQDFLKLGFPDKKLMLLPYPINTTSFNQKIESLEPKRDVILVSNLTTRKRPDLIYEVVKSAPELTFTIYGKNWDKYKNFKQLINLPNLELKNFNYDFYPKELRSHRLFLSLSDNESGPVPLLESLACGLRVVATDTGTARDLIENPMFILPIRVSPLEVVETIKKSLASTPAFFDTSPYTEEKSIELIYLRINKLVRK